MVFFLDKYVFVGHFIPVVLIICVFEEPRKAKTTVDNVNTRRVVLLMTKTNILIKLELLLYFSVL